MADLEKLGEADVRALVALLVGGVEQVVSAIESLGDAVTGEAQDLIVSGLAEIDAVRQDLESAL